MNQRMWRDGSSGVFARGAALFGSLLSLHCSSDPLSVEPTGESEAPFLSQTVHAGVESNVFVKVEPYSRCALRHDGMDDIELHSDARGVAAFFVSLEKVGMSLDYALSCTGPAPEHRVSLQSVRVSAVPDAEAPWAPTAWLNDLPYPGRLTTLLTEDPERVTLERLAELGLPEKPDRAKSPTEYATWLDQVTQPIVEVEPGPVDTDLEQDSGHEQIQNYYQDQSTTWCGFDTYAYSGVSHPLFDSVYGSWAVPSVASGSGVGTFYSSIWVGLGGSENTTNVAFPQAGTEQKATCIGLSGAYACAGTYYTWVEYYPDGEQPIPPSGITVVSGQVMSASVGMLDGQGYANPKGTIASIVLTNLSLTPPAVVKQRLTKPSGKTFYADSAEWILERPLRNNAPSNLAKIPDTTMKDSRAVAYTSDGATAHYFSYGDSTVSSTQFTMTLGLNRDLATVAQGAKYLTGQQLKFHWLRSTYP